MTLVSDVRASLMQDGYRFVIGRSWAELSGTIKTMLSMDAGGKYANSHRFLGGRERRMSAPDPVGDALIQWSSTREGGRISAVACTQHSPLRILHQGF